MAPADGRGQGVTVRHALRRMLSGGGVRIIGIPVTAVLGLLNTGLVVAHTGSVTYGIVNTVATLGVLLPFADLGMGVSVTTAVGIASTDPDHRVTAVATVRAVLARLCVVAIIGLALVWAVTLTGGWSVVLGRDFSTGESMLIGVAVSLFFLALPCGVGARALVGLDRNHVVVAVNITATGWALVCTLLLAGAGAQGIPYVLSGFTGTLVSNAALLAVALVSLRRRGMGLRRHGSLAADGPGRPSGLLAGSGWMLLIMVGLPVGLETGRLVLAHRTVPVELSLFALGAQLYALTWSVLTTSGQALWPIFARQRGALAGNLRLWRHLVLLLGAAAVVGGACLVLVGPWLSGVISQGELRVGRGQMLAFAALLLVQALHLPAGMMLTRPEELRWQAGCVAVMAAISITVSITWAPTFGGVAVTTGAAAGVLLGQFLPDLVMASRLLRRRPGVAQSDAATAVTPA